MWGVQSFCPCWWLEVLWEVEWWANVPNYQQVMLRGLQDAAATLAVEAGGGKGGADLGGKVRRQRRRGGGGRRDRPTVGSRSLSTIEDGGCFDPDRSDFVEEGPSTDGGRR